MLIVSPLAIGSLHPLSLTSTSVAVRVALQFNGHPNRQLSPARGWCTVTPVIPILSAIHVYVIAQSFDSYSALLVFSS